MPKSTYEQLTRKAQRAEMRHCALTARAELVCPYTTDEQNYRRYALYIDMAKSYRDMSRDTVQ